MKPEEFKLGLYKHFKGAVYIAMTVGTHTETNEPFVVYKQLGQMKTWIRPLDMFTDMVPCPDTGISMPRFTHTDMLEGADGNASF